MVQVFDGHGIPIDGKGPDFTRELASRYRCRSLVALPVRRRASRSRSPKPMKLPPIWRIWVMPEDAAYYAVPEAERIEASSAILGRFSVLVLADRLETIERVEAGLLAATKSATRAGAA